MDTNISVHKRICLCIYIYAYGYIYVYIYTYVYIYIYICIDIYLKYIYLCIYMYIYIFISVGSSSRGSERDNVEAVLPSKRVRIPVVPLASMVSGSRGSNGTQVASSHVIFIYVHILRYIFIRVIILLVISLFFLTTIIAFITIDIYHMYNFEGKGKQ
jgi:hypothetical protein